MFVRLIRKFGAKTMKTGQKSPETIALRQKVSSSCEKLIWDFFENGGQVVIYDANNGTRAARQTLAEKFNKANIHVIMLGQFFFLLADQWRIPSGKYLQNHFETTRRLLKPIYEMSRFPLPMCVHPLVFLHSSEPEDEIA